MVSTFRVCVYECRAIHFLSSLCSALGAVIALLLCGQLFAVDTGNESTDNAGRSSGLGRSCTSGTAVSDPIGSAPSLQEDPDLLFSS